MINGFNNAVVVGGGTMGSGIAQVFLESGATLVLIEVDQRRADSAAEQVKAGIRSKLIYENNRTDGPQVEAKAAEILANFSTRVGLPAPSAAWSPDLVIESVFEDVEVKSDVLTQIETVYPECPLVATNTSSLSINILSSRLLHSENFIGMHFFNPVPRHTTVVPDSGVSSSSGVISTRR